jgi:hypothetical protein
MERSDFGHIVTKNNPKWPKSERSIRYNSWSNQDNSIIFSVLKFSQHRTLEKLTKEVLKHLNKIWRQKDDVIFPPKFEKFEKVKRQHFLEWKDLSKCKI